MACDVGCKGCLAAVGTTNNLDDLAASDGVGEQARQHGAAAGERGGG